MDIFNLNKHAICCLINCNLWPSSSIENFITLNTLSLYCPTIICVCRTGPVV